MSAALVLKVQAEHPANPARSNNTTTLTASQVITSIADMSWRLKDCRVLAVLADNSTDWIIADLAAPNTGIVHLPIPTFFTADQINNALTQTDANAVLTDQPERITAPELGFTPGRTDGSLTLLRRLTPASRLPQGTAKISFTSGSTGNPKGVCLSATGLLATAQAIQTTLADLQLTQHLAVLPLTLLLENSAGIYAALLSGAQVPSLQTLNWRGMAEFDPAALQLMAMRAQAHSLILVPELLKAWTLYLMATNQWAPSSLRFVAVGGAHVDLALLSRTRQMGIPAFEGYGLTECGSVVSINRPGDQGNGVGRVLPHVQLDVSTGEVRLQSQDFLDYTGDAVSTTDATRDFATGDLGCQDNQGHLHLMGRSNNLLITTFGRNISPEWVESTLLAQNAILQDVVMGDARPCLATIVVPMPVATPEQITDAIAQANTGLPDYAHIQRWLISPHFTLANQLATGNGRPIRASIASHFAAKLDSLYQHEEPNHVVL